MLHPLKQAFARATDPPSSCRRAGDARRLERARGTRNAPSCEIRRGTFHHRRKRRPISCTMTAGRWRERMPASADEASSAPTDPRARWRASLAPSASCGVTLHGRLCARIEAPAPPQRLRSASALRLGSQSSVGSEDFQEIVARADDAPLAAHLLQSTQLEAAEPHRALDLTEDWLVSARASFRGILTNSLELDPSASSSPSKAVTT